MQTWLLSDEEVRRYANDFVLRLEKLGKGKPITWLAIGRSGDHMVKIIAEQAQLIAPKVLEGIQFANIGCDRNRSSPSFGRVFDRETSRDLELPDKSGRIAVIDSAVHSGSSMRMIVDALWTLGARDILTYTLTLKRTSEFIPSYFGMLIGEHDRAYFLLDSLPNNRLNDDKRAALPGNRFGVLRALRQSDALAAKQTMPCEVPSISELTLGDLWYEVRSGNQHVYVYEIAGEVFGFISFKVQPSAKLHLDVVARDHNHKSLNVGGQLLRWAETYARSANCFAIELWGIEGFVPEYEKREYRKVPNVEPLSTSTTETYYLMQKRILYNLKPDGLRVAGSEPAWG